MNQKNFYHAFGILYDRAKEALSIYQKEDFYRLLFKDVYALAGDGMFDNDAIRKITSGNMPIHLKAVKRLRTCEGFELLRSAIEANVLSCIGDRENLRSEMLAIFNADTGIPGDIKKQIHDGAEGNPDYSISRTVAGILVCLNHSDYLAEKGKGGFFRMDFMRLSADRPLARYPRLLSESPDAAVKEFIGRVDDLKALTEEIGHKQGKLLVSAVGGLGKTELAKAYMGSILESETTETGIEAAAWIPYDNHDIRISIKQSLHMKCDLEDVWLEIQNLADGYGKRLLLVVDNVEASGEDDCLGKLSQLPCRVLVTSRQRELRGFSRVLFLQPLNMVECRELFYRHYGFDERDHETLNDVIDLTARLTIMIVFIAKAAYLEGMTLRELHARLVEKGFKLSEEDVSCEHEKMQDDETIIRQMCILFSLVSCSDADRTMLTYISVIPNLQFDFPKAKRWFGIKKNSSLARLFKMGMLEHVTNNKKHIYWIHSVIAAAVREQQKESLYETAAPFVHKLSEEMDFGEYWGKGYTKTDLIPFSWSVADLFENHWCNEEDATFLLRLYYICYEANNFPLCRTLIQKVLEIDKGIGDTETLIRDYKNYGELCLRMDMVLEALENIKTAENYMAQLDPGHRLKREWAFLWHQYGNLYYHIGEANTALDYYTNALEYDMGVPGLPARELATDYAGIAAICQMCGDLPAAYGMLKKAVGMDGIDGEDSESVMNYYYLANICTDFVSDGYESYRDEAEECYQKVISFRERNLTRYSNDLADVYLEYSNFLYQTGEYGMSLEYSDKARDIYFHLYGADSYSLLQCLSNHALVLAETGDMEQAVEIYEGIIERENRLQNISVSDLCKDCLNYATLLENSGRYQEALPHLFECVRLLGDSFPDDCLRMAQPYIEIADCYTGMEDYRCAITWLSKLEGLADAGTDLLLLRTMHHKLGACHAFLGEYREAAAHYEKALALCNEEGETDAGYVYVDLCLAYHWLGDGRMSRHYLGLAREFAGKFPDDAELAEYAGNLNSL